MGTWGFWCMSVLVTGIVTSQHLLTSSSVELSVSGESMRGVSCMLWEFCCKKLIKDSCPFFFFIRTNLFVHLPLTHHSCKWGNWFLQCEETAGHKFKGHRNFSPWLKVNDILCSHRLIVILCRSSAQLSLFFQCTIANGELLYPSLKASCVCLEKKNSAKTYLYFLHAFAPGLKCDVNI